MNTRTTADATTRPAAHGLRDLGARRSLAVELPSIAAFSAMTPQCPTCLAADNAALDAVDAGHPGVQAATCPTCGVTSLEYGLTLAMDALLDDFGGLEKLDAAL